MPPAQYKTSLRGGGSPSISTSFARCSLNFALRVFRRCSTQSLKTLAFCFVFMSFDVNMIVWLSSSKKSWSVAQLFLGDRDWSRISLCRLCSDCLYIPEIVCTRLEVFCCFCRRTFWLRRMWERSVEVHYLGLKKQDVCFKFSQDVGFFETEHSQVRHNASVKFTLQNFFSCKKWPLCFWGSTAVKIRLRSRERNLLCKLFWPDKATRNAVLPGNNIPRNVLLRIGFTFVKLHVGQELLFRTNMNHTCVSGDLKAGRQTSKELRKIYLMRWMGCWLFSGWMMKTSVSSTLCGSMKYFLSWIFKPPIFSSPDPPFHKVPMQWVSMMEWDCVLPVMMGSCHLLFVILYNTHFVPNKVNLNPFLCCLLGVVRFECDTDLADRRKGRLFEIFNTIFFARSAPENFIVALPRKTGHSDSSKRRFHEEGCKNWMLDIFVRSFTWKDRFSLKWSVSRNDCWHRCVTEFPCQISHFSVTQTSERGPFDVVACDHLALDRQDQSLANALGV